MSKISEVTVEDRKLIELTAEHYRALGKYYREELVLDERGWRRAGSS